MRKAYIKYMADCPFCVVHAIKAASMPAWVIGTPASEKPIYLRYINIELQKFSQDDFRTMARFTPSARLTWSLEEAFQITAHERTWSEFIASPEVHGIVFDNSEQLNNKDLSMRLENLEVPKDWDVILLSETQYVMTKRAARIYSAAIQQYHLPLKVYLQSFDVLKVIKL